MSSFAKVETAARVRDIIKRGAAQVVSSSVPGEMVGRVVSVDLPRRTARVWFTGDEQPMSVKLFTSTIPGQWQGQLLPGMTASTNLVGYGSMVVCQRFRGELYITDVLTGGQFSYDLATMNQKFVSTYPYAYSPNSVFGQVVAAKMHVTIVQELNLSEALEFGPFIKVNDQASSNWVKISINTSSGTSEYQFNMSDTQLNSSSGTFNRWFRIMPFSETTTDRFDQRDYFDLDIVNKSTSYGTDADTGLASNNEYWFRMVKRSDDFLILSADVSIETSMFDKPRSVDGNERLIMQVVTNPEFIRGYVGFHNSQMNIRDLLDTKIRDDFNNRTSTSGPGTSEDGTVWTTFNGAGTNYTVSGGKIQIIPTSAGTTYNIHTAASRMEYDHDVIIKISPSHVATGGSYWVYVLARRTANTDYYRAGIEFTTSGQANVNIEKVVASSGTGLEFAASAFTYVADGEYWIRFQIRDTKLRMKAWNNTASQPLAWNLTEALDTSHTTAGSSGIQVFRGGTNTNSTLVVSVDYFEDNLSQQVEFSEGNWATGPWRTGLLDVSRRLTDTWTISGGNFSWDGTSLGWTGEILLTGIGRHRNALGDGLMYVTCPRNVSNYVIPVFGNSSPTTINTTTAGVPLAAGRSLYVAVPPGERSIDLMENLFLVDSSIDGVDFQLPEWAVLIAHRQPGTEVIRLANGEWPVNEVRLDMVGANQASVTNAYLSVTGGTLNFTKHRTNTKLELDVRGSSVGTVAGDKIDFALQINGVDYSVATFVHNGTGRHDSWSGLEEVAAGIVAGTYTVTLRYKRLAGTGSVTCNADDRLSVRVRELPL